MEQRISQRDILRRFCVALSDIIPQQKRAHPAGGFFSYRKAISYTRKNPRPNGWGFVMYTQGTITFFSPFYISIAAMSPALLPYPLQKWSK